MAVTKKTSKASPPATKVGRAEAPTTATPDGDGRAPGAGPGTPAALPVSKVRPAYHQVAEQLRSLILGGELGPGARLPTEPELSTMFGVSRSTVREALRVLSSQHLVVTTRGATGGTSVAFPEPEYIGDFLEASFGLMSGADTVTVDQFLELREQIEVPAARLAAERRSESDLVALKGCLSHGPSEPDDTAAGEERAAFHQVLLESAGNPLLSVVARPVIGVLRGHFLRELAPPQFWHGLTRDHEQIFSLIQAGDADGAGKAMQKHLARMRPVYVQVVHKHAGLNVLTKARATARRKTTR
jgi:GntR family transcriptional repressor for pyruvate dehydrogenase complex